MIIVGLLIKLTDGGTVLFKQKRIGKGGIPFQIYKFRTMSEVNKMTGDNFEPGNTSRITHLGRILRNTKFDEIPQLINVLMGQMSIVGPRPEVEKWINLYPEKWQIVLSVKPGITDYSSIVFAEEEAILSRSNDPETTYRDIILPQKLNLNIEYVYKNTFKGDIKIIITTLNRIISNSLF